MKKKDCNCPQGNGSPFWGDGLSRRHFVKIAGTGVVMSFFADVISPSLLHGATTSNATLHNTAKSCILVFLSGAPSNTDMWDLKEGAWTPADFAPATFGQFRWPQGLLPKMADQLNRISIIRTGMAWAAVHPLAQKWAQIARNPSGATGNIAPHLGAVVSMETQKTRTAKDVLPGFIAMNGTMAGAGYFPAQHAPFGITASATGLAALTHPDGAQRLSDRWNLVKSIDSARATAELGKDAADMSNFYDAAKVLIDTPNINQVFSFSASEHTRYGATNFGDSLLVARNVIASDRGARFIQVTFGGWDHHSNIYGKTGNSLYSQCKPLDDGMGALLTDLATTPGTSGSMLLDETLVVIIGEFGRTTGPITANGGRDHYLRMSAVFAGGGVRGGHVMGVTDQVGNLAKDYGSFDRDVRPEDVAATIYSALGIDYTTVRPDDPLGRGFEYVPFAKDGTYKPVDELF
ncbi:MAG TPA: DUF1501 domain-containing protein [Thermoanaerobaculia bacterium]|jgi:hypothetical protein